MGVPKNLQATLWSKNTSKLNLEDDKEYIVHQILAYGGLDQLKWLFKVYKPNQIRKIFIEHPEKNYSEKTFNFVQKIMLEVPSKAIDKRNYVKTFPRIIR